MLELLAAKLADKIETEPNSGCWIWIGARFVRGYGQVARRIRGVNTRFKAHRVVYAAIMGPLAEGLELDHKCRNKSCVNPSHLEEVTHRENLRRTRREACSKGHPFTPENSERDSRGSSRRCRRCHIEDSGRRQAALMAADPNSYRAKHNDYNRRRLARVNASAA